MWFSLATTQNHHHKVPVRECIDIQGLIDVYFQPLVTLLRPYKKDMDNFVTLIEHIPRI